MITLKEISKSFGSSVLFEDVTISFNPGNRYGLTGPNGCGKSTLLKIIMKIEESNSGSVTLPNHVGMLRQNIEDFQDERVIDVVVMSNQRLWDALKKRDELYEVEFTDEIGMALGDIEGIIAEEDGYSAESKAEVLLSGMGLEQEYFDQKMSSIPNDMQFRVLLCQALFGSPEALLLDEPTNHLDLNSINWLETFLENYKGTLIVTSHDRYFLNSVTTHIADIDYDTIIIYPGNYDEMVVSKTTMKQSADLVAKSKEKKVAQLREFVAKFSAGTRASQVQSRIREMKRLQPQELKKSNIQRPYIRFKESEKKSGKIIIKAEDLCKNYDENKVIEKFSIEISKGDKVGIVGNNGMGKTTLLKMLADVLKPDQGEVELGHQVQISYFSQNHAETIDKSVNMNAFDWLKKNNPTAYDQDIRGVMGKMLFGGDDAFKSIVALSGGETARLILANMMLSNHNVIILDEPNNHLDLEAVSALGWGLNEYPGTVIVVSHDRDLIDTVANKLIAFEEDGIHIHNGGLEEYLKLS